MKLQVVLVSVLVFVAVCCLVLATVSSNTNQRISQQEDTPLATNQQPSASTVVRDESVLSARHSNARLRLLADYTRAAETTDLADPVVHSISATVRPIPAMAAPRRATPPAQPPPPPSPKLSESPVLRLKNSDARATANIVVNDYVANTLLGTVFLPASPADIPFHLESASHEYQLSGTVQLDGESMNIAAVVCTESASVVLIVTQQQHTAELRCDAEHSQPATVTLSNETPEDAQITVVDGTSGAMLNQLSLRPGMTVNLKEGNPNSVFVTYARIQATNWRPAGCKYRGTVHITGSSKDDSGVKLMCDDEHKAKPAIRIINGSGECPVQTSIFIAEKAMNAGEITQTQSVDEFSVNCGDTAESFIGSTETNSSRRITVKMADGSTPSIICPAGSTVLIGGSGLHC